ncbi:restriction endonuclease subunit S [Larkinella sp. GY13]|uniref:restriction endonuclease subunit S n=1 Tax=Larkinella sp. GY13 TaxID=3453720 RepID=UPI003EEE2ED8
MIDTVESKTNETLKHNRYADYKDSGVDWLGEIPAHWDVVKLKYIFQEKKHKANQFLQCGSISFGKVVIKDDEKIPDSTRASYQEVLSGEFLINPLNLNYDLISLRIALSYIDVVVSPGYIVLRNIAELNRQYFKFLLHRYDVAYMKLLGSGVRQTISFNHIANSLLILPPLAEQTRIADFLDRKTAQIDQAIAQKERLIELLNERRQVMIHQAVTRGLNPDVPMEDSGIEWIGEIPAHWKVAPLTKYASRVDYRGKTPEKVESGIFLVTTKNIKEGKIDYEISKEYVLDSQYKEIMSRGLPKIGDILFTMEAPLGMSAVVDDPTIAIAQRIIKFQFNEFEFNSEFVNFSIQSEYFQIHLQREGTGSTAIGIKASKLHKLRLLKPDIDEQVKIAKYLNQKSAQSVQAIMQQRISIQKLQELKSTLINSAVTGKIKV